MPAPTPAPQPARDASADPSAGDGTPVTATILLSDGANSTGQAEPLDAAREAAAEGMPIYTIALGTPDGVVEVQDQFGQTQQLQVPPDTETLQQVAEMTGGRYFDAPTAEDLAAVYESLGSKVGYTEQVQEVTQWFAAACTAARRRRRRARRPVVQPLPLIPPGRSSPARSPVTLADLPVRTGG